jgi:hypothetical protein
MVLRTFPGITLAEIRRMNVNELARWWDRACALTDGPDRESADE